MGKKIKFRVPVFVDKKFHHFHYWGFIDDRFVGILRISNTESVSQQYTNMEDNNGKEIYEGDRVEFEITNEFIIETEETSGKYFGEIMWDAEDTGFFIMNDSGDYPHVKTYYAGKIKVTGNIYEPTT